MAPVTKPKEEMRVGRKPRAVFYPESDGKPMAESPLHQELMIYSIVALKHFYANNPMAHVAGNNFLYYVEGNTKKSVSPDIYVVYGVRDWMRPTYKVWEEGGITPSVVIEITSKSTRKEDRTTKFTLYEQVLRVNEYICYDSTGDYLRPHLQGFRLEQGAYVRIPLENGDRIYSRNLGLCLVMQGESYRFLDPRNGELLKSPEETQEAYEQATRAYAETQQAYEQTSKDPMHNKPFSQWAEYLNILPLQ